MPPKEPQGAPSPAESACQCFPCPVLSCHNLAINVYGWENDCVIVHKVSEKDKMFRRINLMLLCKDGNIHYC